MSDINMRVCRIIIDTLKLEADQEDLTDDISLLDGGLGLDSVSVLQLIVGLEDELWIEIDDDDFYPKLTLPGWVRTYWWVG